ncbi:hypothetical protein GBAR_LOCUS21249 [Geodia barretti]|uniref:Uncharacterized protein n=1 Tax=Geodia barretti TaxID=519541 RepID=A0AA35SXV0_GEOBA|nr:hypothetical protein GBAR_LOCUS21249 [Geodia barretti]
MTSAGRSVPAAFIPTRKKRSSTARGSAPATTCRFTNTATACCLWTKTGCPSPNTFRKTTKVVQSMAW